MSLAISMASASSLKRNRAAAGPNVSSRKMSAVRGTSTRMVGWKKVRPSGCRAPPSTTLAPRATASAMCASTFSTASMLIIGPWVTPSSMPLPTRNASTAAVSLVVKASYTPSCTSRRLAQTQVCPALRNLLAMAPTTAASRSASSNTMKGALPPSSMLAFFTVGAICASSLAPTSVLPVKLSLRTTGLLVSSPPMGPLGPVMTLHTPGGIPARSASTAMASAE